MTVDDVMTEENIEAICALDLFPEYDHARFGAAQSSDRDTRLLRAWLADRTGALQ